MDKTVQYIRNNTKINIYRHVCQKYIFHINQVEVHSDEYVIEFMYMVNKNTIKGKMLYLYGHKCMNNRLICILSITTDKKIHIIDKEQIVINRHYLNDIKKDLIQKKIKQAIEHEICKDVSYVKKNKKYINIINEEYLQNILHVSKMFKICFGV